MKAEILFCSIVFFTLFYLAQSQEHVPRVNTALGNIRGIYKISENGSRYAAYQGIPYARPPIGKLRFEAPEPITAWTGELDATNLSDVCLQYVHKPDYSKDDGIIGSEDCLYLNVYSPDLQTDNVTLPVIIWFHGGAFMYSSGKDFAAKYLIDENIITVTINYRLGPLGFLSTEDDIVPGNMGLKDQSLALRWVHDNIKYFGGDPKRVTLVGLSAGGASVHYHYFSRLSAGLFQNGMSISGTALDCWAQTENSGEKAKKLGLLMGCPTESTKAMIKCLKGRPAKPIVHAVKNFMPWLYNPFTPFGPVVEKFGDKPFINRSPIEMLRSNDVLDVPWITSVTKDEGLYPIAEIAAKEEYMKELDKNWVSIAPHLLDFNFTIPQESHAEIATKIRKHYLGDKPINRENIHSVTKMVGDRLFVVDAEKAARMQSAANKSPVFFYYYTYRASGSFSDIVSGTKENFGVSHGDDAWLAAGIINPITKNDRLMHNDLLNLLVYLAENRIQDYSNEWKKVDPLEENLKYLLISGPGQLKAESNKNFGDKHFWNSIKFNENILNS